MVSRVTVHVTAEFFHSHFVHGTRGQYLNFLRHLDQREQCTVVIMQMSDDDSLDLVLRDAAREQVFVEIRNRIDQDVIAVVAQRQSGTGLIRSESGRRTKDFETKLYQFTGNRISL